MNIITSSKNPIIKEVKALKNRKFREQKKLFFIEGIRFVEEALKEKADIVRIFLSQQFYENRQDFVRDILESCEIFVISDALFKEISDTDTPQGVLAVMGMKYYDINNIKSNNNLFIVLDSIQDPGNMGTIIRTADAAGFTGVIASKGCVDIYNSKVLRSTMGSIFHIPLYQCENIIEGLNILKANRIKVYAAHLGGKSNYFDIDMKDNIAVIIGNEANGISDDVAACADELVKIPMPGRAESLNASVAASLLIYESVRQNIK